MSCVLLGPWFPRRSICSKYSLSFLPPGWSSVSRLSADSSSMVCLLCTLEKVSGYKLKFACSSWMVPLIFVLFLSLDLDMGSRPAKRTPFGFFPYCCILLLVWALVRSETCNLFFWPTATTHTQVSCSRTIQYVLVVKRLTLDDL